ncbi:hypochlorite stress DNA-binding transcriptional regulator HypT [Pasteurellaceae bacterium LIM206]|nr:hypochlorite stress DNA-binding transcriptional regulator HypT [Pasteurellaceae bacterium LIM206]
MKNIETKWLEDFLALEEVRNFSQAAELRNISQSAFSRRILSLEEALGIKLFNRTVTPLQLTEEGKLFHSQTRNILNQLQYNLDELLGHHRKGLPNIKFSAAHSLSLSVMPQLIKKLSSKYQNFIYSVESIDVDQTVTTLIEGKSDFIFSFYDELLMQPPFLSMEVLESKLFPATLLNERGMPSFQLDEVNFPLLNYTASSYMGRLVNRTLNKAHYLEPETIFISSMSELLKNMVLNQQGIAWLPEYTIKNELKYKKLCTLGDESLTIPIKAYIYRIDTRLNNTAELFWNALKENL